MAGTQLAQFRALNDDGTPWTSVRVAEWLRDQGKPVLLAMSRGKDSLGAWSVLRSLGVVTIPFHMDLVPGMKFVDKSIEDLERVFDQHVVRLPHPFFYQSLRAGLFQTPQMRKLIAGWVLPAYNDDDVARIVCEDYGLDVNETWIVTGVRSADSPTRYTAMRRYGPVSVKTKRVHLLWDWTKAQLYAELVAHQIPLPIDYTWFGRSFDGVDYRFIEPIRRYSPQDYERLLTWFPLLDVEWRRYRLRSGDKAWGTT